MTSAPEGAPAKGHDGESLAVEFTWTEEGFVGAAAIPTQTLPSFRRRLSLIVAPAAVPVGIAMILAAAGLGNSRLWLGVAAPYLLFLLAAPLLRRLGRRSRIARARRAFRDERNGLQAPQRVVLSPAGVALSGVRGVTLTRWPAVRSVVRLPQGIGLYLTNTSCCLVPYFAFSDDAAHDRFESLARQLYAQSRAAAATPTEAPAASTGSAGLSFALTLEDHVDFLYFARTRSFARRHGRFFAFTSFMLAVILFGLAVNYSTLSWPDAEDSLLLAVLVLFVAAIAAAFWYGEPRLDRQLYRSIARGRGEDLTIGPARLEILPEGVHVEDRAGRRLMGWRSILAIETGSAALYLFVTPQEAQIVPRRAFAGDAAFDGFVAALRQRWQEQPPRPPQEAG